MNVCHIGDCRDSMRQLIADGVKVQMCVTSPPYWGLRDYQTEPQLWDADESCDHDFNEFMRHGLSCGLDKSLAYTGNQLVKQQQQQCKKCAAWRGSLGLEPTPELFVQHLVQVFRLVRELMADDGTLWLNLGDSYAGGGRGGNPEDSSFRKQATNAGSLIAPTPVPVGLKAKDLVGIPWRVAFALQADGWYLRQDIIWAKPNPMPESVRDRCTKSHEYIFLLSKRDRYYFDAEAIAENAVSGDNGSSFTDERDVITKPGLGMGPRRSSHMAGTPRNDGDRWRMADGGVAPRGTRNKRSVWTVSTKPYSEAHFATFPPDLIEPCILAGSKPGDIVLDPFFGSGTTGEVAQRLGRQWIGCELNPEYAKLQDARTAQQGMVLA